MELDYDYPPYRPPSEAGSALLRVVRGCTWNKCAFCGMYKDIKFEQRRKEEVFKEIEHLREFFPVARTAFLGDSNPLVHKDIVEIVRYLRERNPWIERVTAYARARTIARMKREKLEALKRAGLNRLHIGMESGDDEILEMVSKGATAEDLIEAGKKGGKFFEISFYYILGLGGKERMENHAKRSAEVINQARPDFVRVRTLTVIPGTPIEKMIGEKITLLTAEEQLNELRMLVEGIKVRTYFTCDHVSNYLFHRGRAFFMGVHGVLPDEKERMLEEISDALELVRSIGEVMNSNDMAKLGRIML
ncbi:MAG: radical SAM protein [Archaeoglobus sp.]|nr:radical SAM protein [Archaeoglobus sp.]